MSRTPERLRSIRRVTIAGIAAIAGIAVISELRDSDDYKCHLKLSSSPEATIPFNKDANVLINIERSSIEVAFEDVHKGICAKGSSQGDGQHFMNLISGENPTIIVYADPKQNLQSMELEYADHTESVPAINDGLLVVGIVKEGELPETIDLIAKDGTVFDDIAHPRANIEEAEKHAKDAITENPEGHGQ